MRMPSKIAVDVEEDRMGNIIAKPVSAKYAKAFAKVRKENGGGSGDDAFFNDGGEAEEFKREYLSSKQRKDLGSGYGVRMKVDPWVVGHWYGYDAHTVAESTGSVLRQRGYLGEGEDATLVVFRKFKKGGDVIALFPYEPGTNDPQMMMSYMHVGQHSSASMDLTRSTTPAKPDEYKDLQSELKRVGYKKLIVKSKIPSNAYNRRKKEIEAIR